MTKNYLVTGGAGFIGSNYAARLIERGENVTIYDNLSRPGSSKNIQWLRARFGKDSFKLVQGDIRDFELLKQNVPGMDVIAHLAGQVAVTTSVTNPREDFEINALGTFNVLEAVRLTGGQPVVIYSSTNKVYGGMEDVRIVEESDYYRYQDFPFGISEDQPLDFHSPYGCSKGAGDQYMRDYHRIYEIPTIVFRQSCIYGTRQFGVEDQGFLAWFVIAAVTNKPITIYGDGKQVRDILFVEDLLSAYDLGVKKIDQTAGQIFNIGGGHLNTLSIWSQFSALLENHLGRKVDYQTADWRPGDQLVYVSNINKARKWLDWEPKVSVEQGIKILYDWVNGNIPLFRSNES